MKHLDIFLISCCILFAQIQSLRISNNSRIVNGGVAPRHSHPYQVQITSSKNSVFLCTGSIIHPEWILTAASCAFWPDEIDRVYPQIVIAGSHQLYQFPEDTWQTREINFDQIYSHPNYTSDNIISDNIALIHVQPPFEFTAEVKAIRIPPESDSWIFGTGKISGWGSTSSESQFATELHESSIEILPPETCNNFYEDVIDGKPDFIEKNTCAGNPNSDTGLCNGDLGTPLEFNIGTKFLVGLGVAWKNVDGQTCSKVNRPDIFTKVATYHDWIHEITGVSFSDKISSQNI